MNRVLSADFLRVRREVLQPEDVGRPLGRTTLLRDPLQLSTDVPASSATSSSSGRTASGWWVRSRARNC
jgi:hypothetical protein